MSTLIRTLIHSLLRTTLAWMLGALLAAGAAAQGWSPKTVELFESLPVQDGGRVKPTSTYANFLLLRLSGKTSLKLEDGTSLSHTQWLLDVMFQPEKAAGYPVFLVPDSDVLDAIGVGHEGKKKRDRYSLNDLKPGVMKLFELAQEYSRREAKLRSSLEQNVVTLAENINEYGGITGRMQLASIPPDVSIEQDPAWHSPEELFSRQRAGETLPAAHAAMLEDYLELAKRRDKSAEFEQQLEKIHGATLRLADARGEYDKIPLEIRYYDLGLIHWSLYTFLLSFVLVAFTWLFGRSRALYAGAISLAAIATVLLSIAIAMRCVIRDRPPVSTLYETVIFITAVGCLLGLFAEWVQRNRLAVSATAILGVVGVFIANGYETLDKRDTMPSLVAVLDTNFWLATHVTAITIGYAAGLFAAVLASIFLLSKLFQISRNDKSYYTSLTRMTYGVLCFGVIFSTVGTILGGIWANDSWGRFWGWDPKENGALLIVLSQLVILHLRMGGYIRDFGIAMLAAFGGIIVAFSWWGVNLLGVGLHSYGFTSGISTALNTYYIVQAGIMVLGAIGHLLELSRQQSQVPETVSFASDRQGSAS